MESFVVDRKFAFVFAHYNKDARLGAGTKKFLESLLRVGHVTIVSTNLSESAVLAVPDGVKVIVRENFGYDFYSYKVGLSVIGDFSYYDYVCVLNNSFVCLEPERFLSRILAGLDGGSDVFGISFSREVVPHLQSYFIAFSREAILSAPVQEWWAAVEPISNRQAVIARYELGLSSFLLANGFSLKGMLGLSPLSRCRALCHAIRIGMYRPGLLPDSKALLDLKCAEELNPTHFNWEDLLEDFGIVKKELFEKNPFRLNLQELFDSYGESLLDP